MVKFELKFRSGNAAFTDYPAEEVARILQEVKKKIEQGYDEGNIFDVNGNNIGYFVLDIEEEEKQEEDKEE